MNEILIFTEFVTLINFQIQLGLFLIIVWKKQIYFNECQNINEKQEKTKKNNWGKKNRGKKEYKWVILLGFEESQVTPVWTHKSFKTFQFKLPFDVNEL